jgi:serine/threonine protein kinase
MVRAIMPHLFSFASHASEDALQEMDSDLPHKRPRRTSLLRNFGGRFRKQHEQQQQPAQPTLPTAVTAPLQQQDAHLPVRRRSVDELRADAATKRVVPSLPRPQTLHRQESEQRERLLPVAQEPPERRALSAERRRHFSTSPIRRHRSPQPLPFPSLSAPEVTTPSEQLPAIPQEQPATNSESYQPSLDPALDFEIPDNPDSGPGPRDADDERELDRVSLQDEYDRRWILNLSMHFRDKSNREKFFVTYAETPTRWRRLTVSLDYREAPEGSLEADLSTLHYQRDKSFRIYEAIRESLPDIQYYDTVTNLKLETTPEDGQLHVHVREDANEIVQYPSISLFQHVQVYRYTEKQLEFVSHISGFVYKVQVGGQTLIKKEIPGPDTVDEFLYEVNALDSLLGCSNVVQLVALVTDDTGSVVKGLLLSYASQGALVDMLYDCQGTGQLPWHRRENWAKQIVQGLSDIHEAGFVQGDFTLSNIVIDEDDNAQIIDINRRGCPVGWEPPELSRLIDSGQRIGMCIGVKTDIFQLGMVLWALAEENDEPERMERPLRPVTGDLPSYFRHMVSNCLSPRPQDRYSAKRLLRLFPISASRPPSARGLSVDFKDEDNIVFGHSVSTHRSDKEYIDPRMAVTIEEVRRQRTNSGTTDFTSGQVTYVDPDSNPASTSYHFESSGSWIVGRRRGRSPVSSRRRRSSPFGRSLSSATSLSSAESAARRLQREPIYNEECVEDKPSEPTLRVYPREISADDLRAQEASAAHADVQSAQERECSLLSTPSDLRLAAVQAQDYAHLTHIDSGFDERMIEELNLDDETPESQSISISATGDGAANFLSKGMTDLPSSELQSESRTPADFYTPAESPRVETLDRPALVEAVQHAGPGPSNNSGHEDHEGRQT